DARMSTIARANMNRPDTRLAYRAAYPPRTRGCLCLTCRERLRLQPERIERLRARRQEHRLRLQVELERVDRELAAEAGLLVAAERDPREGRERHVDADHAGLDRARDTVAARRVARPDGGEEAVADVVGDPDRVLLVLERDRRHDRAEDL